MLLYSHIKLLWEGTIAQSKDAEKLSYEPRPVKVRMYGLKLISYYFFIVMKQYGTKMIIALSFKNKVN